MAQLIDEQVRFQRYQEELPADLIKARKLLESYTGVAPEDVEIHLRAVRQKAWAIFPYACIGRWRFLDLYITALPEYPSVLSRIKAGATFLDAGCCFGYVLRQLALDGAPPVNLIGSDLRQEYIDLGYELFRDRESFGARFLTGNLLEPSDAALAGLDGTVDIIHAASLFHLFSWADQVRLGERLVRFFKPNGEVPMVFGRQRGSAEPVNRDGKDVVELGRYDHDPNTLQELWDEIGSRTGTIWKVDARLDNESWGEQNSRTSLKFAVYKVD